MLKHFEPFCFGENSHLITKEDILNILGAEEIDANKTGYSFTYLDIPNMRYIEIKTGISRYALVSRTISVEISEVILNNPTENDYNTNLIWQVNLYQFSDVPHEIFEQAPKKNPDLFEKEKNRIVEELRKIAERQ